MTNEEKTALVETLSEIQVELMSLDVSLGTMLKSLENVRKVMIVTATASIVMSGMYLAEKLKNKKLVLMNKTDAVLSVPADKEAAR